MTKKLTFLAIAGAALMLGLTSANEAQARFGSNGSSGSHGGFFSGSHGSSGGNFGGLFSRHGGGSSGGSASDCGGCEQSCNSCGNDESAEHDGDKSTNPPAAPKDPGTTTGQGASASVEPIAATKAERVVMQPAVPQRRLLLIGR